MRYIFALVLVFFASPALATTYYVDSGSTGCSNPDTDYTVATKTCGAGSATVYATIQGALDGIDLAPGDIVDVRLGTYAETVSITSGDAGSASSDVTLRAHTGETVTVTKFVATSTDYITIDGFTLDGWSATPGDAVSCITSDNFTLQNSTIQVDVATSTGVQRGAYIADCTNVLIDGNTFQTDDNSWTYNNQLDFIRVTGYGAQPWDVTESSNGVVINNNQFLSYYSAPTMTSSDVMQITCASNVTFSNNYVYQPRDAAKVKRMQGPFFVVANTPTVCADSQDWGDYIAYNNLIVGGFSYGGLIFEINNAMASSVDFHAYNNTISTSNDTPSLAATGPFLSSTPAGTGAVTVNLKNNIFIVDGAQSNYRTATITSGYDTLAADNNMHYVSGYPSTFVVKYDGATKDLATWNAYAGVVDDVHDDPSLAADYTPNAADDPVIDTGSDMSAYFTIDRAGIARPQNTAWDIGAYEYIVAGPVRSNGSPSSNVSYTTTVTLSLNTDIAATCKYDTTAGTAYASMDVLMTGSGTTSHSKTGVAVTPGATNTFYVRCIGEVEGIPNLTDYIISFIVLSESSSVISIGTGGTVTTGTGGTITIQ